MDKKPSQDEGAGNIWKNLLSEAAAARRTKLHDSTIIFLGDPSAGKSSLVARFCSADNDEDTGDDILQENQGRPLLSYSFFDAIDPADSTSNDEDEAAARVKIWSLSDASFKNLLSVAVNQINDSNSLHRTICMIGLDLSRPWTFPDALTRWSKAIDELVKLRIQRMKPTEQTALALRQATYLARCYGVTREEETSGSGFNLKAEGSNTTMTEAAPQLPDGVLENNLGMPIIVVGLKADLVPSDSFEEEQKGQYIQQYLRSFCLRHGAALVYASAATDINRLLLQRYILHRLYPETFAFSLKAQARREDLFVPAGWDSTEIVSKLLSANVPWSPSATYNEVISPPKLERTPQSQQQRENYLKLMKNEQVIQPNRAWLEGLQQQLEAMGGGIGGSDARSGVYTQRKEDHTSTASKTSSNADGKLSSASAAGVGGGSDKAQIRNFFEGLLSAGAGGGGGAGKT